MGSSEVSSLSSAQPFLRWAGGKTWFARRYSAQIRSTLFRAYHEPFLGSGAVFFSLALQSTAFLSDNNSRLIEAYRCIRDRVREVIEVLSTFSNTETAYYAIRETSFDSEVARAAQFIYLNQTSYNGIYRENYKGKYNVPYGHRTKDFIGERVLLQASHALANTQLFCEDFFESAYRAKPTDLFFLDPPYTVSHNKNGFIKYNKKLFNLEDFVRLRNYISVIRDRGAYYILTNANHDAVKEIFDFGDPVHEVSRANLIGGKRAVRGPVSELIFTNLEVPSWGS
jgi:DNA adenine methylase